MKNTAQYCTLLHQTLGQGSDGMGKADSYQQDIKIWHSHELQADLIHGHFRDYAYDVHTHEQACFALLTEGSIRIRMKGHEFTAGKGDLYAIDADVAHAGWRVDNLGWKLRTLYVDINRLNELVRESFAHFGAGISGPVINDPYMNMVLYNLHASSEINGPRLFQDQCLLKFADSLLSKHTQNKHPHSALLSEPNAVRQAREYLDIHLDDSVSLQALSNLCAIPVYRLFRAFSRYHDMTPHEYQRQARIRRAMEYIRQGKNLVDASSMSGFTDQAHFTRWFRRFMGITPGAYKKAFSA